MATNFNVLMSTGWYPTVREIEQIFRLGGHVTNLTLDNPRRDKLPLKNLRLLASDARKVEYKKMQQTSLFSYPTDKSRYTKYKITEKPVIWMQTYNSCRETMLGYLEGAIGAISEAMRENYWSPFPYMPAASSPYHWKVKSYSYSVLFAVHMSGFNVPFQHTGGYDANGLLKNNKAEQIYWHNKGAQKLLDEFFSGYAVNLEKFEAPRQSWVNRTKPYRTLFYKNGLLRMYERPMDLRDVSLFFKFLRDFPKMVISIGKLQERVTKEHVMNYLWRFLLESNISIYQNRRVIWLLAYIAMQSWGTSARTEASNTPLTSVVNYNGPETYMMHIQFPEVRDSLYSQFWTPYKTQLVKFARKYEDSDIEEDDELDVLYRMIHQWKLKDLLKRGKRIRREDVKRAVLKEWERQDLAVKDALKKRSSNA